MTRDQQLLADMRNLVDRMPPDQAESVNELADFIRATVRVAGEPVWSLAVALVMAEINEK